MRRVRRVRLKNYFWARTFGNHAMIAARSFFGLSNSRKANFSNFQKFRIRIRLMTKSRKLKNEISARRAWIAAASRSFAGGFAAARSTPASASEDVAYAAACPASYTATLLNASSSMKRLTLLSSWSDARPYPQGQSRTEEEQ
jgi:hypothetical protein